MKSRVGGAIAVALILVLCGWLYSRQGVLRLSAIEFENSVDLDLELAMKRKIAPFLGANLLTLSLSDLQKNLQTDPRINKVILSRRLPSTLGLRIVPRVAVAKFKDRSKDAIVVDDGNVAAGFATQEALPNWIAYRQCEGSCRQQISQWLLFAKENDPTHFGRLLDVQWRTGRGLYFRINGLLPEQSPVGVDMGITDFVGRWPKVKLVLDLIGEQKIRGEHLMALGEGQVVISGVKNLHNLKNELNLKEMVRRATPQSDTRAKAR